MGGEMAHVISAADDDYAAPVLGSRDMLPRPGMEHGVQRENSRRRKERPGTKPVAIGKSR
jgi:hypothetical protein